MRRVPIRELNQHTADVIARVEAGERIEITRNGTTVAVIAPASPHPLAALIESGKLRQAPNRGDTAHMLRAIVAGGPYAGSAGLDAVRRRDTVDKLPLAEEWLRNIDGVTIGPEVMAKAAAYARPDLRSLDAIHLATAERITVATCEPLEAFVTYDSKLCAIAEALGLPMASPGST